MILTKPFKALILEFGMLGGVVLVGYTLPAKTPLLPFVIASAIWLVVANAFVIRKLRSPNNAVSIAGEGHRLSTRHNRARIWLLFVAISFWGAAFDSMFGPRARIALAALGITAFLLAQRAKRKPAEG